MICHYVAVTLARPHSDTTVPPEHWQSAYPQATIQRELTRIHTPATLTIGHVSPDAVHLMVRCMQRGALLHATPLMSAAGVWHVTETVPPDRFPSFGAGSV